VWSPVGVVNDLKLAEAMADLVREGDRQSEVSVVSADDLLHEFRSQDREPILDRLNSRTTTDIQRDFALRRAAEARLARGRERRAGLDRRSGLERRSGHEWTPPGGERRSGGDRRSGRDRRAPIPT
jgi:hypothetical protein